MERIAHSQSLGWPVSIAFMDATHMKSLTNMLHMMLNNVQQHRLCFPLDVDHLYFLANDHDQLQAQHSMSCRATDATANKYHHSSRTWERFDLGERGRRADQ